MRAHVHPLIAVSVFMLLGLAAAACSDGETTVTSSPAEGDAVDAVQASPEAVEDEDEHEEEDDDENDEGAEAEEPPFEVRRGCPACHRLVEPDTGKYTLGYEAHERAGARGKRHPKVARDGTPMGPTDEPNVAVCLTCHGAGSGEHEGMGRSARLSLRDIAHPSHLFSETFVGRYRGNCMSCHNVSGEGVWQLLSEAVQVNEKGVPSPDQLPIPGLLDPSRRP